MKAILLTCVSALIISAQPVHLRIVRATHQQIVVGYNAPVGVPCRVEASDNLSFSPIVNDVNPALFVGADSDLSRSSTHVANTTRFIVLGQRASQIALNGKHYSRSLQSATPHYVRISGCGGSATIAVATTIQPFGLISSDTMPDYGVEGMEGFYGFPTLDPTDRAESYIDPLTGNLIRKVQLPGDSRDTNLRTGVLGTPSGANWMTPQGAALANDGIVASYSDPGQDPLYIPNASFLASSAAVGLYEMRVNLRAEMLGDASGDNAIAQICMGKADGTCVSEWRDINLSTCSLTALQGDCSNFGDATPYSPYWRKHGEFAVEEWFSAGGKLGFLLRKKTLGAGRTLRIDSIGYVNRTHMNSGSTTSVPNYCTDEYATNNGDGKKYQLCAFYDRFTQAPLLYSIDVDSGNSYYLGPAYITNPQTLQIGRVAWDKTNPLVFYTSAVQVYTGRDTRIYRCAISSAPGTLSKNYTGGRQTQPPSLSCLSLTPTSFELTDQVKRFHPEFTTAWENIAKGVGGWGIIMQQSGKIVFSLRHTQDAGAWIAVFDPNAPAASGCIGCIGRVVAASPMGATASPQPRKFCTLHSVSGTSEDSWIYLGSARQIKEGQGGTTDGFIWGGPWKIKVKKPGCDMATQNCAITASDTVLELIAQNGSYNWNDPNPVNGEGAVIPLEVGDLMIYSPFAALQWQTGSEYIEVMAINEAARTITVRRGTNILTSPWIAGSGWENDPSTINTARSFAAGTSLYGICRATAVNYNYGGDWVWNFKADPLGTTYVQPTHNGMGTFPPAPAIYPASSGYASPNLTHFTNFGDHGTYDFDVRMQYTYRDCPLFYLGTNVCYVAHTATDNINTLNTPADRFVQITPAFAGQRATSMGVDTHVKRRQIKATGRDADYVLDIMPMTGVAGSQTNVLVAGTRNVYAVSGLSLSRKHFATLAITGDRILKDISGPGSLIDDSKPFTYCVALVNGECRPNSVAGNIFANSPVRTSANCGASPPGSYPTLTYGICILNRTPYTIGVLQTDISRDSQAGDQSRLLAVAPIRPYAQTQFSVSYALANGKWALYLGEDHGFSGFNLVKASPIPDVSSRNPLTFDRLKVDVSAPPAAAKARVEFGYEEHGSPSQYRCTTRSETCVVTTATVVESAPFQWKSETNNWLTITASRVKAEIPRIPGRVVYSRVLFSDANGNVIGEQKLAPM
jgi:hypothetical protein